MQCLKRDVKKHDLPKAVNTLKSILEVKNYSLKIVAVVAGVSVLRKTKIAENLHIEPINNLPKGGLLKHFIDELANDTKNRMNPMSYSPLQGDRIKFLTTQRCALVYDYGVVEAYQDDEEKLKDIQHKQLKISSSLYEIAYAISAAHSCAPFVELKCMIADHEGLNNLFSTGGGSIEIAKLIPTDLPKSEPIDNDYVANFIDAYLSIQDDTLHQKVKIALQYYVESQWVYDIRDKIIGHAIALECLLLDRNTKQKTKNLSKRASSILASSKKEKAYYFTLFQIFYGLRSDIVHAGHLKDKKYKMTDGEELFSQQIYNKVKELIPVIIKHLVQKST